MDIKKDKIKVLNTINPSRKLSCDVREYDTIQYNPKTLKKATVQMKVPISIDKMIEKFELDNNWIFNEKDYENCFNLMSHVNFYTFKHYAKKEKCTCFSEAETIFYFDRFLQNKIHKISLDIEMGLRTKIVDSLSLYYLNIESDFQAAQFFLDPNLYFSETGKHKRTTSREKEILSILYNFQTTIEKNKEKSNVKNELSKYSTVSAWVLFDLLTLGDLSFFFGKLTTKHKKVVANSLNENNILNEPITGELVASWLNSIRYIRNKAAHGSKIYGEPLNTPGKIHKNDLEYHSNSIKENHQNRLVNIFLACKRVIACLDKHARSNWNETLIEIDTELKNRNLKLDKLGFTEDWLDYFMYK